MALWDSVAHTTKENHLQLSEVGFFYYDSVNKVSTMKQTRGKASLHEESLAGWERLGCCVQVRRFLGICFFFFFQINLKTCLPSMDWCALGSHRGNGKPGAALWKHTLCSMEDTRYSENWEKPKVSVEFMYNCEGQVQLGLEGHKDVCDVRP